MKHCMRLFVVFSLVALITGTVAAIDGPIPVQVGGRLQFTISNPDLATMRPVANGGQGTLLVDPWYEPYVNCVHFEGELLAPDTAGWRDQQIGWRDFDPTGLSVPLPDAFRDVRAYDSLVLSVHNLGPEPVYVQLFMNAGWTDPTWDQPDVYAQSAGVWAEPCKPLILDLDFLDAERWIDGTYEDWGAIPVENLQYVTAIGFKVGANQPVPYYHLNIDTIPEPLTMLGLCAGLGAVGAYIRKRRMA